MGKMIDEASKAAFHAWGVRHEKGLIRWHRAKLLGGWSVVAVVAGFVIAHTYGPSISWPSIEWRWVAIATSAVPVGVIIAISLLAAFGGSSSPRMLERPEELREDRK